MLDSLSQPVGGVAPYKWKEQTYDKIKKVYNHIHRIERAPWNPLKLEATVAHKDICAGLSNQEALKHARSVRNVVLSLQEAIVLNNEEIKRLNLIKQSYEKYLYNIKVDQKINVESQTIRNNRPQDEKKMTDGADDLLSVEKVQLHNIKRHLEVTLKTIREHLINLNDSRKLLVEAQRERSRVLDLLCQKGSLNSSDAINSLRNPNKSFPAKCIESFDPEVSQTDPLAAYTPSCKEAIQNSKNCRRDSENFRNQIANNLDKIQRYRNKSAQLINDTFVNKLLETEQLRNQLQMARVRARSASHKAHRLYTLAEKTMEYNRGPEKYQDLLTRERLDRPVMKIFQRHPGTQLPEAQELIKIDKELKCSVSMASEDILNLQAMDAGLYRDIQSKAKSIDVDKQTLRWRRCKSRELHCK